MTSSTGICLHLYVDDKSRLLNNIVIYQRKGRKIMHQKEMLQKSIKTIFGDTRQAIVTLVVVALVGGYSGLLYLSKTVLDFSLQLKQTATPLWATIALTFLCCLYTYVKVSKSQTKSIRAGQPSKSPPADETFIKSLGGETISVLKTISETEEWITNENLGRAKNNEIIKSDLLNADYFAGKLKTSTQKIKYHLDQLNAAQLIYILPNGELSGATPKGRAFLHGKGLLP
jgi:hypothetical protein